MVRKVLMTAVLLALSAATATAAPPPDVPGAALAGGAGHRITPEAALADARIPGAIVEVASGLTLRQAVGLDQTRRLSRRLAATGCWNMSASQDWDFYPFDRHLNDYTSWCGSGGVLTYRSSHFTQTQTLCQPKGTYAYKLAGGAGETYVAWQEGGTWGCATPIPWVTLYQTDWMNIYVNGGGAYWIYERGGN